MAQNGLRIGLKWSLINITFVRCQFEIITWILHASEVSSAKKVLFYARQTAVGDEYSFFPGVLKNPARPTYPGPIPV